MNIFLEKNFRKKQACTLYKMPKSCVMGIASVLVVVLLLVCFRRISPFIYQTNDDLFLRMIISGEMTGTPEPHSFYISYPAGVLLSRLYKLFPQLPWYGLFFCFTVGMTMAIVLYHLLKLEKSLLVRLLTVVLFSLFSYGFVFLHIAELQFTVVTGIAGCGALFLFTLASPVDSLPGTLKNYRGVLALSAYAYCIRDVAFLMLAPFIGIIGLWKYLDAGSRFLALNKKRKNLLVLAGAFAAVIGLLFFVEKLAYSREDWKVFNAYTEASMNVYDYDGFPDYDKYRETYRALGMSRSSYEAAAHHYCIVPEPGINQKTMESLEAIVKQERRLSLSELPEKLKEMAALFLERHISYTDRPLNLLVYCCYILFFLGGILSRKWNVLRDILFLGFARMVIWVYLLFYGRFPSRVSQPVYLAELVILLAVAFGNQIWLQREPSGKENDEEKKTEKNTIGGGISRKRLCRVFWVMSAFFLTVVCLRFGFPKARAAAWEASSRLRFSESFADMKNYFREHPDNFYYLDMHSFEYFTEDALQKPWIGYANFLYLGGWTPWSPWYATKFEREGILDSAAALYENPNVFVVFMDTEETGYGYLIDFYAENHPGVTLEVVDTVNTANELRFLVLKGYLE